MQLNKVFLAGFITRDINLRYTPGGVAVASFGLAINRKWKDKGGEQRDDVCFVDINAFGRTAEVMGEYLKKGNPVFIEGRLQFSQWEKDGQKRSALRVVADSFQFLSSGSKGSRASAVAPVGAEAGGIDDINTEAIPS